MAMLVFLRAEGKLQRGGCQFSGFYAVRFYHAHSFCLLAVRVRWPAAFEPLPPQASHNPAA
eukprot:1157496-Pelagomonas_calceolata.AAC.4